MTKKKALESYNRSRYNSLKHGRYSIVLKDYPCTKTKCPIFDFCEHGKKEDIGFCELKKEAAISMLKNGMNIEKINMTDIMEAELQYSYHSLMEHALGGPSEYSRKWLETKNKLLDTAIKIEKTRKASGDSSKSIKETMADAVEILRKRDDEKAKKEAVDTSGHTEKY